MRCRYSELEMGVYALTRHRCDNPRCVRYGHTVCDGICRNCEKREDYHDLTSYGRFLRADGTRGRDE